MEKLLYDQWKEKFLKDLSAEELRIAFGNNESVMKGLYMQSDLTVSEAVEYFRYAIKMTIEVLDN